MCEFCVKHGDGKRWYFNAANYLEELLADSARRQYIRDFIPEVSANAARYLRIMDRLRRVSPGLLARVGAVQSRRMKRIHFGQVIPLEDVVTVLQMMGQVVRIPCICRQVLQKREEAVCYLLAASLSKLGLAEILGTSPEAGPYVAGLERIEPAGAVEEMAKMEARGSIHTIWTFMTPYIGAICNCNPQGCLAMNFTARGLSLYFPGEEVARVAPDRCGGCGDCLPRCLFSALSLEGGLARVDSSRCHGCGICRRACARGALVLENRRAAPVPARLMSSPLAPSP